MNEQKLADLFSEQVDRMLRGESPDMPPKSAELADLLNLGETLSQTQFQAAPLAQAAFLSQIASWFGLTNGGSPMTILGLSKSWLISIFVAVAVIITGAGIIAVIVTRTIIMAPISSAPDTPTPTATETPSGTVITPTLTATPTLTGSLVITATPTVTSASTVTDPITIVFQSGLVVIQLCQGAYSAQTTLINYGSQPISDADLVWEIIEGDDLVEAVNLVPDSAAQDDAGDMAASSDLVSNNQAIASEFIGLNTIAAGQKVKLDIKVKVKSKWWNKPDGAKIKIKLKVKSKNGAAKISQTINIVKQGGEWITLTGFAHPYDDNSLLIDGNIVVINNCTDVPIDLPPGSGVEVIVVPQGDGSYVAVAIVIVDVDIIIIDFDSGGSGGSHNGSGGSHNGSGGSHNGSGGSHKGSGGSKK